MGTTIDKMPATAGRSTLGGWVLREAPYIAMLILALVGVLFDMSVGYWVILTPIFGLASIIAGWRRFSPEEGRKQIVGNLVLIWFGLILAIVAFYSTGVRTTMQGREQALGIMTLLAFGTFVAGTQVRVWQFCTVGILLYLAVMAMGWMGRSPLVIIASIILVIAAGTFAWWLDWRTRRAL